VDLLLKNLSGISNREAQFRTVIALILGADEYAFEGVAKGKIIEERRGEKGFGYDPIFVPEGMNWTFAELDMEEKNRISHRVKAVDALVQFLTGKNF